MDSVCFKSILNIFSEGFSQDSSYQVLEQFAILPVIRRRDAVNATSSVSEGKGISRSVASVRLCFVQSQCRPQVPNLRRQNIPGRRIRRKNVGPGVLEKSSSFHEEVG